LKNNKVVMTAIGLLSCVVLLSGCLNLFGPKEGTVSGFVKAGADPVVGAIVSIPGLNLSAVTNAQGAYSIGEIVFGSYVLVVYKDDAFLAVKENVTVEKGKDKVTCNINLDDVECIEELHGSVSAGYGGALSGTTVSLSIGEYSMSVVSDEAGEFMFSEVPFGKYAVRVIRNDVVVYEASVTVNASTELEVVVNYVVKLDPNLETVVRTKIDKPEGDLTPEDVAGIEVLEAKDKGITSLSGLQHFTALRVLKVDENSGITDVSPLATITTLQEVFVNKCSITDLSPLAGLPNLFRLEFNNMSVTSLAAFEGHTGLRNIMCHSAQFTSIEQLPNLPNLEEWIQGWAPLASIAGISTKFPKMKKLNIPSTPVSDITELLQLEHLQGVQLPSALNSDPEHPVVKQLRDKGVNVTFG
jgi:hypothetical protein